MRRQRRGFALLALLLSFGLFAAACGSDSKKSSSSSSSSSASDEAKKGGTITLGAEQWPACLNPITQCANSSWLHWAVVAHVLPRLMELDDKGNFVPSPVLAGDPELKGDGTSNGSGAFTITYKIADKAVWDDGSPITSADIAFTEDAYMKTTGAISTTGFDQIDKIDSTDPKTAVVTFKKPYADWQDLFGGNSSYVLKKAAFAGPDTKDDLATTVPFSGGPFKLDSFTTTEADFSPNTAYWDADRIPNVDKLITVSMKDSDTEINSLLAHEVDAIFPQPSPGITENLAKGGATIKYKFGAGTTYENIWFDQSPLSAPDSPIKDKAVREALLFAIDRQAILDQVIHPNFPDVQLNQCAAWVPTVGDWCGNDFGDVKPDPAKVASILEGDGWAKGSDGIYAKAGKRLSMKWATVQGNKRREDIQALIIPKLKAQGIELIADNSDADTLFQTRLPHLDFEIGIYAQTASPDPSVTTLFACDQIPSEKNSFSGQNSDGWCNQDATAAMLESDKTPDPAARLPLIQKVGKATRADAVLLPLYQLPLITSWDDAKLGGPVGLYTSAAYSGFSNVYDWYVK